MTNRKIIPRRAALKIGGAAALSGSLVGCGAVQLVPSTTADATLDAAPDPTATPTDAATPEATAAPLQALQGGQYRAMWVSYLEWMNTDFSSETAFLADLTTMLDNCVSLGLNTVILQVRPFGDAFYPSEYYPWSHFITGTQGQAPSFDPLALMVSEAHARSLAVEAWINPYRLRLNETRPETLADTNLYYTHPDWVVAVDEGLYLNPAIPEVADYVCAAVMELLQNYAVDGIHFDDYFYPTTAETIDDEQFAQSGESDRSAWRRANVTALVQQVYRAIKADYPDVWFGISPQGNPDNNLSQQYSDVASWMMPAAGEECVDYICPQVYWGYNYTLQSGSERFGFQYITAEWLAMARSASVALSFGLGAYRIGDGDGGQNADSTTQWNTGENLAAMVADVTAAGADGYALYRYDSLYASAYPDLATAEIANLAAVNQEI